MDRLAKKHWRVESEEWSPDEDIMGVEAFSYGESIGFTSEDEALDYAASRLRGGYWVKVQQYGFDFDEEVK